LVDLLTSANPDARLVVAAEGHVIEAVALVTPASTAFNRPG